jgi:hypothetical protein
MTSLSRKVIEWWYSLTKDKQIELINKYYPKQDYVIISSISSRLEDMFYNEQLDEKRVSN